MESEVQQQGVSDKMNMFTITVSLDSMGEDWVVEMSPTSLWFSQFHLNFTFWALEYVYRAP